MIANANVPAGNIDGNVVWAPNGSTANASNATLTEAQWKALGHDRNGLAANPAFTNPAAGDYSVGASSPALGRGAASLAVPPPLFPSPPLSSRLPRRRTPSACMCRRTPGRGTRSSPS